MEPLAPYMPTAWAMGLTGFLILVQIVVADIASIKSGHKPGIPIPPDTSTFLFRAARAHANTNESVAIFVLLAISGMLLSAPSTWLNYSAWAYVACRGAHMIAYYLNRSLIRSLAFGASLVALSVMLIASLTTLPT